MDSNVIYAILCTATVFCIVCLVLHRRYRRTIGKVTFLFNAIDNLDFSFNFPEKGRDKLVNESLNRIRRILETARREAIERERYYEQIINAVSTGIMVVDERGCVLQHNEAALRLLGVEALTFESQAAAKLASEDFSVRDTTSMLHGKKVRIIAFSDIRNELSSREMESWTKLIRVLTHEIMNNVAPITSLSETLSHKSDDSEIKEGLSVINSTGKQLLTFVDNYRRMTLIPQPQPKLFYVKPFLERMVALVRALLTTASLPPEGANQLHTEIRMGFSPSGELEGGCWAVGLLGCLYLVVPLIINLVLTILFSTLSMGMVPSTWAMRMSTASSPTRFPRCSTVVSIGSQAMAR